MILGTIVAILLSTNTPMAQSVVFADIATCEAATARAVEAIKENPELTLVLAECRKI